MIIGVLGNDSDPDGDTLTITEVAGQPIGLGSPVTIPEGTVALNPDGTLSFTPNADFNGPVSFDYTVSDGTTPVSATVDITVTPVNDVPVAADDTLSAVEDTPLTGTLRPTTPRRATVATSGRWPRVRPTARSRWAPTAASSTPNADYNGPDSFTYTITDADGDVSTATATINVAPTTTCRWRPTTPDAVEDTVLTGSDRDGDTRPGDGQQRLGSGPGTIQRHGHGRLNGSTSHTPNADYNGPDSFTYGHRRRRRHLDRHRDDQRRAGHDDAGGGRRHPVRRGRHAAHGHARGQRHPIGRRWQRLGGGHGAVQRHGHGGHRRHFTRRTPTTTVRTASPTRSRTPMATSRPRLQRSTSRRRTTPDRLDDTATTAEDTPVIIACWATTAIRTAIR